MSQIAYTQEAQIQTQWCWAAVSVSVALFYDAETWWTQCRLAQQELNQPTCCQDGSTSQCNQPWYLQSALIRTKNLAQFSPGAELVPAIEQEVDANRPMAVRIQWNGGGGHFVVVSGYETTPEGDTILTVNDPWAGVSRIPHQTLSSSYRGMGSWSHSYFTQHP
jgi:hypothetical protein